MGGVSGFVYASQPDPKRTTLFGEPMKVTDLTHTIHAGMPVFPGTEPPTILRANTLEKDGFAEVKISMYSHTGTHMDAPAHMLENAATLDQFPAEKFIGKAMIIDVTGAPAFIGMERLAQHSEQIQQVEFVLFQTGWSRLWGQENYFKGFPALTPEAAAWLVHFNLKGIGMDAISLDVIDSTTFEVHKILLGKNLVLIENLTNLDAVESPIFLFSALPMKFEYADGAPLRAVAIEGV
jgi:arylformamidase